MAKKNYGGVYANMEFPPYIYQEYPKHIASNPYGKYEVANNPDEEKEIRTRLKLNNEERAVVQMAATVAALDPEHENLLNRARLMGIPFNRKWSNEKLCSVIAEAVKESDNLPPEENTEESSNPEVEETEEEDKDELIARAKTLGINANKVWGVPRIKREIAEAEDKLAQE